MATVIVTARRATGGSRATVPMLAIGGSARATQVITSGSGNAVSTVIGNSGEVVIITSSGGAVKLADSIAANPNAETTPRDMIADGGRVEYYCDTNDTRFAVADV